LRDIKRGVKALKEIPGGESIAEKIEELIKTGNPNITSNSEECSRDLESLTGIEGEMKKSRFWEKLRIRTLRNWCRSSSQNLATAGIQEKTRRIF
jgi:DNA polymerase/3'-5' exonuclease PolX